MIPQALQHEPLFDVHPLTGVSIEVFYSDRTLETFGRGGAGWFWWPRRPGYSPVGPATGPFATSYAAYRHAMGASGEAKGQPTTLIRTQCGHRDF
jgi:hypothetical protein